MKHDLNLVALEPGAHPQPQAKKYVDGPVSITMGDPLHKETPRRWKVVKQFAGTTQVSRRKTAQFAMNGNAWRLWAIFTRTSTPHVNCISTRCKFPRHQKGVIANAANFWRVFTGDDVPAGVQFTLPDSVPSENRQRIHPVYQFETWVVQNRFSSKTDAAGIGNGTVRSGTTVMQSNNPALRQPRAPCRPISL